MAKELTKEDHHTIWAMFKDGKSPHGIAGDLQVSHNSVMTVIHKLLLDPSLRPQQQFGVFGDLVEKPPPPLWMIDPTIGDVREHPEILERYN